MKKVILFAALFCAMSAVAAEPTSTTTNTQCVITEGSTKGVVVGGSVQTCVTTHADGSRTVTETSCAKAGASASVGVASGSATYSNCTTTTTNYPANSGSSTGSYSTSVDRNGQTHTKTPAPASKGTYLGR